MKQKVPRTANKIVFEHNGKKAVIESVNQNPEFLDLKFTITTPKMDYSDYFDVIEEQMRYLAFWGKIKIKLRNEFKLGKPLIVDIGHRDLNYFKPVSKSKLTIIITFKNLYGSKWYENMPMGMISDYIADMQVYLNDKHNNLSERVFEKDIIEDEEVLTMGNRFISALDELFDEIED